MRFRLHLRARAVRPMHESRAVGPMHESRVVPTAVGHVAVVVQTDLGAGAGLGSPPRRFVIVSSSLGGTAAGTAIPGTPPRPRASWVPRSDSQPLGSRCQRLHRYQRDLERRRRRRANPRESGRPAARQRTGGHRGDAGGAAVRHGAFAYGWAVPWTPRASERLRCRAHDLTMHLALLMCPGSGSPRGVAGESERPRRPPG